MLNFQEIKEAVSIMQVAEWLALSLKKEGNQFRGPCPWCDDGDPRHLVITPNKGMWFDFCPHHRGGGDCIQLTAQVRGVSVKSAADEINRHFRCTTPENKPVPTKDDVLKPLEYLDTEHEMLVRFGLSKEAAEKIGAGFAPRGTMRNRLLLPLRDMSGKLVAYVGINLDLDPPVLLPRLWHW